MRFTCKLKCLALVLALLVLAGCGTKPTAQPDTSSPEALAKDAAGFLLKTDATSGSDWSAFALARWDREAAQSWLEGYAAAAEARIAECGGVLHERKYTEYSRLTLALTALGKDATQAAGYNLLLPLADFDQTVYQGINGAVTALLALDCGSYAIPENPAASTQATRELYLQYILAAQLPAGGWALSGEEAEIDLTAMALQALSGYHDRGEVAQAIDKALAILSQRQNSRGGYTSYNADSSEAVSQTIIALATLGISLDDPRFVKDGNTLLDALLDFRREDGGFAHLLEGKTDRLATEQALLALTALVRTNQGDAPLYQIR